VDDRVNNRGLLHLDAVDRTSSHGDNHLGVHRQSGCGARDVPQKGIKRDLLIAALALDKLIIHPAVDGAEDHAEVFHLPGGQNTNHALGHNLVFSASAE